MKLLKQPYPFYYQGSSLLKISIYTFTFITLFYFSFTPFQINTDEHKYGFLTVSMIHAIIPSLVFLLSGLIFKMIGIDDEKWTLQKELLFLIILLLVVGLGQYLIRDLIYNKWDNWAVQFLIEEIRNTFAMGIIFFSILIPVNYNRLYRTYLARAADLTNQLANDEKVENDTVRIQTHVKSDDFDLNIERFLFAKSDGNYLEFYFEEDETKQLKRISIKELASQLVSYPFIFKSHRSFIVNLTKVKKVAGNAQGYKLQLKGSKESAPVSRQLIPEFEKALNLLTST